MSAALTSMTLPQAKTLWNRNEILTKPPLAKSHHNSGPDRTRAAGGLEDGRFAWEKGALHYGLGSATNWPHDLGHNTFHLKCIWLEAPDSVSQKLTAVPMKTLENVKTSNRSENKDSQ